MRSNCCILLPPRCQGPVRDPAHHLDSSAHVETKSNMTGGENSTRLQPRTRLRRWPWPANVHVAEWNAHHCVQSAGGVRQTAERQGRSVIHKRKHELVPHMRCLRKAHSHPRHARMTSSSCFGESRKSMQHPPHALSNPDIRTLDHPCINASPVPLRHPSNRALVFGQPRLPRPEQPMPPDECILRTT